MLAPFDYQQECLAVTEAMRRDHAKRALVVMASGLGKTVTVAFDAKSWRQKHTGRFLYLCHQNDILYQAKTTFEGIINQGHTYGYFHGQDKNSHKVDFLFASLQTMKRHKESFGPDEFAYIVVDESHHSSAQTYRSTIEYFKPDFLLGVTATPNRLDELSIRDIYGEEVYSLPLDEAMARGLVTPVDYRLLTDEIQISGFIETGKGQMSISKLNRKIFIPRRDEEIAKIIARHISGLKDPRVIIFCNSVHHCDHLAKFIPNSFAIHSRIPQKERAVRLELFRQGLVGTVLAVDVFNEGIDIPQANVIVFLRSTDSATIFLQQLGRGLRKKEEKEKVIILDFVANCERIKMVYDLYESVERTKPGVQKKSENSKIEPMTLNINTGGFKEKVVPILKLLERVHPNFYPTWQEASVATINLGIKTKKEYRLKYSTDPRLHSSPQSYYRDFLNWPKFLATGRRAHVKDPYPSWQEASAVLAGQGIATILDYRQKYKDDQKLPSQPSLSYADFPGWPTFLGRGSLRQRGLVNRRRYRRRYLKWQEVANAVEKLGIKSMKEYRERYQEDSRLPVYPERYKEFPGWRVFFSKSR